MKKKFIVLDPFSCKEEHALVNEAFIDFFDLYNTIFILNDDFSKFVKENKFQSKTFPLSDYVSKSKYFRWFNRDFMKTLYSIYNIIRYRNSDRHIVFFALSEVQYFIISFFCKIFNSNVSIVMHHYAESFIEQRKSKLSSLFLYSVNKFIDIDAKFLFLSKHINKNISDIPNSFFINHPLPQRKLSSIDYSAKEDFHEKKLALAVVGLLSKERKNSNFINKLNYSDNYSLSAIGRFSNGTTFEFNSYIKQVIWDGLYHITSFENEIKNIDGFLYFFDKNQYRCTASGTVIDAILYNKFVFYVENDAISSLLNGYSKSLAFNSIEDMSDFLDSEECTKVLSGCASVDRKVLLKNYCITDPIYSDIDIIKGWANITPVVDNE